MKKFALIALTLSSLSSFATSIRSTAMELVDVPLRTPEDGVIIRVAADGEVFGGTCDVRHTRKIGIPTINYSSCNWKTVKFLTRHEVRTLSTLTKDAAAGTIVYPKPGGMNCLAIPTRNANFTANNGGTVLQSGSYPCGDITYNSSASAKELVKWLRNLQAEYNKLVH